MPVIGRLWLYKENQGSRIREIDFQMRLRDLSTCTKITEASERKLSFFLQCYLWVYWTK